MKTKPQREAVLRIPGLILLAVSTAALALTLHLWGADGYLAVSVRGGVFDVVPHLGEMRWRALTGHLLHLAELGWLCSVFAGCGRILSRVVGLSFANAWERLAFDFGLGAGVWAQLFFLLGLLGLLCRPLLILLLAIGSLPALWALREPPSIPKDHRLFILVENWPARIFTLIFLVHLLMLLPYALVPETFYDSLEYHLALPQLYLLRHGIHPTPENSFSGMPSIPSMLFGWALTIDPGGILAHLLSFSFLSWSAVAMVGLAVRFNCASAGPVAAALFAFVPVVSYVSYFSTVELSWGFYQLLCFPAVLSAIESPEGSVQRRNWLVVTGLCLGFAMATKYLAWALPFALLTFAFGRRSSIISVRASARELLPILGAAALVLLPWIIKNVVFYRNPIYPFLHESWVPTSEVMPGWRYLGAGTGFQWGEFGILGCIREYVSAPWRMTFSIGNPADSLGPILLAFAPLVVFVRLPARERLLGWFALGCWLPLSFLVQFPRYFIPCLPMACLLIALALSRIDLSWLKRTLTAGLCAGLLIVGYCFWNRSAPRSRWDVFTGRKSSAEFLSHRDPFNYPAPYYPAAEYLERHAPAAARVLVFGDSRGFYIPRDFVASTPMQESVLERWANASSSGRQLKARLDAEKIAYILVNHAEIVRQNLALNFSSTGKHSLDEFWKRYTLKVFQAGPNGRTKNGHTDLDQWVVVYKVLSEEEATQEHPHDNLFEGYSQE
ncbi:MAG: hypothetical protein AAB262_09965 [Elusimicrobiota bacterium]